MLKLKDSLKELVNSSKGTRAELFVMHLLMRFVLPPLFFTFRIKNYLSYLIA